METSLHRALKLRYALAPERCEQKLGRYRIDAIGADGRLIEIQHGSLGAIRRKIRDLLHAHDVLVVKPIVVGKQLVRRAHQDGPVIGRRRSPKQGSLIELFHELVYFVDVFPHERLTLEVLFVDIEEWRYPGHGRRRRWRANDHVVEDQHLVGVRETLRLATRADLRALLPPDLPKPFHSGHVAQGLDMPRWVAQRVVYCLRRMEIAREVGKTGNTRLYEWTAASRARRKRRVA
ncbi:MAG: hypothetical protein JNG90_02260 [Planctomycetaceae bacterium]|nr:hypothetical protein [Planctomycetaceae bacterium]